MHREALMAFARTARTVTTRSAGFAIFAGTLVSSNVPLIIPLVVYAAILGSLAGVHLSKFFVPAVSVTANADVVILIEKSFATITMHVDIR